MRQTLLLLLFTWFAGESMAQAELKRPYKPATTVTPTAYSTSSPTPATYSTSSATPTTSEAEARRAAALAKVQGKPSPSPTTTAKGLSPAMYSTNGVTPAMYSTSVEPVEPVTTVTVNGLNVQRSVRKGRGQVGDELFTPVSELHYVQFAVYCKDTPVDKAPGIDGLYLLWHPGSTCPGGAKGASYIVKGYTTPEEAKAAVASYKAARIDCWYNPALTGAEVEIIGVR
jgi:hypothetical protein